MQCLEVKNQSYLFKLTALWAFVEVALGGMLHALRVPLTGVVVGGTAVAIISLMGRYSPKPFKDIIAATGLVLLVKAGASPHSPLPAYLAVGFQGLLGAWVFQFLKYSRITVVLFSLIAMLESGFQKLILLTVLYGKSLWDSFDVFFESVLKSFQMQSETSGSSWIVGLYIGVYFFWGLYLGVRLFSFDQRAENYVSQWKESEGVALNAVESTFWRVSRNRNLFWLVYLFVLIMMSLVLIILGDNKYDLFYVVFRSMSAIFLVFWVVNPLFTYWVKRKSSSISLQSQIQEISDQFAFLQRDYFKALQIIQGKTWHPFRYFKAMEMLISIHIFRENASKNES